MIREIRIQSCLIVTVLLLLNVTYGCREKQIDLPGTMRDIDGNVYKTIKIGNQVWMSENLRVMRYRNGTVIPCLSSYSEWSGASIGLCTDYEFLEDESKGKLYNWYAVEAYSGHHLAPEGWHIPSKSEWQELIMNLGGTNIAGSMMKDTLFWRPVGFSAKDVSGFGAVPAGERNANGHFVSLGEQAFFWSSSIDSDYLYYRTSVIVFGESDNVQFFGSHPLHGYSVRCVKD